MGEVLLQWVYTTANSCAPVGYRTYFETQNPPDGNSSWKSNLPDCLADQPLTVLPNHLVGGPRGELFLNCAEVTVRGESSPLPPFPAPVPPPPVAPPVSVPTAPVESPVMAPVESPVMAPTGGSETVFVPIVPIAVPNGDFAVPLNPGIASMNIIRLNRHRHPHPFKPPRLRNPRRVVTKTGTDAVRKTFQRVLVGGPIARNRVKRTVR